MERELSLMEKQAQEAMVEILKDVVDDNKKIIRRLQFTIVFIVALLIGSYIFYDYSFKSFISGYNFSTNDTITTNNDINANNNSKITNDLAINSKE